MPNYVVTGVQKIDRKLRRLEATVGRKIVVRAMRANMKRIQAVAKSKAPKGVGTPAPGTLKRAIKVRAMRRSRTGLGMLVQVGKGDFMGATYYGAMVEFGTRKQDAQDYLREAYKLLGEKARDDTIADIVKALEAEIRRG